jgi:hypothetical protein
MIKQMRPIPIDLFAKYTFQTETGLGDTILREKWPIVGDKRDQLWMKVWRFGFGQDVSGSTISEGGLYLCEVDAKSTEDE